MLEKIPFVDFWVARPNFESAIGFSIDQQPALVAVKIDVQQRRTLNLMFTPDPQGLLVGFN
jgi:hypothetical protein